jgi:hypothetical protein
MLVTYKNILNDSKNFGRHVVPKEFQNCNDCGDDEEKKKREDGGLQDALYQPTVFRIFLPYLSLTSRAGAHWAQIPCQRLGRHLR